MNEHSAFFGALLDNAIVISNTIQRYKKYQFYNYFYPYLLFEFAVQRLNNSIEITIFVEV